MVDQTLKDQLAADIRSAMKAGEKTRLGALRMFLAAIKHKEVEGKEARELSDEEVREVAAKEVKKRTESIEAFEAAGRTDLVERERAELDVLAAYAPPQLSEEQVDALVAEGIAATGASSPKELGKVMGFVMSKAKGRVDGSVVQKKVRSLLGG